MGALALDHAGLVCAFHRFGSFVGIGGNGVAAKGRQTYCLVSRFVNT
jgi:hypothetical protein